MATPTDHTPSSDASAGRAKPGSDGPSAAAEARSFAEAGKDVAKAGLRAGEHAAGAGRAVARQAGDQAEDLIRAAIDPFAQMQKDMARWMEMTWGRFGAPLPTAPLLGDAFGASFAAAPRADVHETDKDIDLAVELPGLSAQDIELSLRGDQLVVSGQKADQADRQEGAYRVRERRFGRFERSFPLPRDVDRSKIQAEFKDGLLKVTAPKLAGAEGDRRIAIKG